MSDIVNLKISQQAVRDYADEVRRKDQKIATLKNRLTKIYELTTKIYEITVNHGKSGGDCGELAFSKEDPNIRDYGPPYGPHNPAGNTSAYNKRLCKGDQDGKV